VRQDCPAGERYNVVDDIAAQGRPGVQALEFAFGASAAARAGIGLRREQGEVALGFI